MPEQINPISNQEKELPLGRLGQPLTEYFKENGIEAPPIEITFLFSPHQTKEHSSWIEPYYKDTDIFIPEMASWTANVLEQYKQIAHGDKNGKMIADTFISEQQSSGHPFKDFRTERIRVIERNPGKEICFIDVQKDTELGKRVIESLRLKTDSIRQLPAMMPGSSLEEVAEAYIQIIESYTVTEKEREEQMILSLPKQIGKLIQQNQDLNKNHKSKLKILIQLGGAHTRVFHILNKRGDIVKRYFRNPIENYPPDVSAHRMSIFDKSMTKEQGYRAFIATFIGFFLRETLKLLSENEYINYLNYILNKLSIEEINVIFESANYVSLELQHEIFEKILARNNIPTVKNNDDLKEFHKWLENNKGMLFPKTQ